MERGTVRNKWNVCFDVCFVKLRTHEQTSPRTENLICKVKYKSLNYLANKVPLNLRGWVAVTESPHCFAWSDGPSTFLNYIKCGSKVVKGPVGVILRWKSISIVKA